MRMAEMLKVVDAVAARSSLAGMTVATVMAGLLERRSIECLTDGQPRQNHAAWQCGGSVIATCCC